MPTDLSTVQDLSDAQEQECKALLEQQLSDDEVEVAARSSFAYFRASSSSDVTAKERSKSVLKMIKRHYVAQQGDNDKTLKSVKDTIAFRQEKQLDDIRTCFDNEASASPDQEKYRDVLWSQMACGKVFIRGHDQSKRALYTLLTRKECDPDFDAEWFNHVYIYYTLERAIACSEAAGGADDQVVVIFDYQGWSYFRNNPPISTLQKFVTTLQNHYPERLAGIYITNPPLMFQVFWVLLRQFIDPKTKTKIHFLSGTKQVADKMQSFVDPSNAQPFMMPNAELTEEVDMKRFLKEIPFDKAYTM